MTSIPRLQRAIGCILGAAVGDALGAPFEFGRAGEYSARFPTAVHAGIGEMVGGGGLGWAPGQFTDDTEMAVIVAESLLASGGLDIDDQMERFRAWGRHAKDVGVLTSEVLRSGLPAAEAGPAVMAARHGRSTAGNGSLMRVAPGAVHFAAARSKATIDAAHALSSVTHADPLCKAAVAIVHEFVRLTLDGDDPLDSLETIVAGLDADSAAVYGKLLNDSWTPESGGPGNGSAMGALAQAIWALRHNDSFADVLTSVIDLGGDTDSVAAVAGTLAGARFGIQAIPTRWLTYVHGHVTGVDGQQHHYDHLDLHRLAISLAGNKPPADAVDEPPLTPKEIVPGVWATNRSGARTVPEDRAMVSLCRIDDSMRRKVRREAYPIDNDAVDRNPALAFVVDDVLDSIDAFLAEGRQVVVHCHGGRSRTALILTAYLMRHGRSMSDAVELLSVKWPMGHLDNKAFAAEIERRAG